MPTHDTRDLTLRCLASVAGAGVDELVVVDDGSSDGTAETVAAAHPRAVIVRHAQARGFSGAANAGLARATGELLWLINSDTEVPAESGALVRRKFEATARLGALGPQLLNPDGSLQWSAGRWPSPIWLFALSSGLGGWAAGRRGGARSGASAAVDWVSGAAIALRRDAWSQAGPFDEGFRVYGQDLDLCWRLHELNWSVELEPGLRVVHVGGATLGQAAGAWRAQQLTALYLDLVRCIERHRGPAVAGQALRTLELGLRLRLVARRVRRPSRSSSRRAEHDAGSLALRRALESLVRG